jgi:hypothetical protein
MEYQSTVKYLTILSLLFSPSIIAEDYRVLGGSVTSSESRDINGKVSTSKTVIKNAVISNCNVSLTAVSSANGEKMKLTIAGKEIIADSFTFKSLASGKCAVEISETNPTN